MVEKAAGDFLKKDAKTPLCASYPAADVDLNVETNSESIIRIIAEIFAGTSAGSASGEFRLRLWVDESCHADEPRPGPYFRGLGHLVFAGFDEKSSLLINLRDGYAAGRFAPELAADSNFWKTVFFPAFLTICGPSVGLTPLRCACVSWKGNGLLLAGESGSGKSTLSLALAQSGLDFLSDDRTLISDREGKVLAWGFAPELTAMKYDELHPIRYCEPRWTIFLERESEPSFSLAEIDPEEAAWRLQKDLPRETPETTERQQRVIDALSKRECRTLRYGGNPRMIAGALRCLLEEGWNPDRVTRNAPSVSRSRPSVRPEVLQGHEPEPNPAGACISRERSAEPCDPLRRFRATPLSLDVALMGKSVRLETDSPDVLSHATRVFSRFEQLPDGNPPQFVWRIMCEPREEPGVAWPPLAAFCGSTIRFINIGQRSFIAIDLRAREAVGILPEPLAGDQAGFSSVFLASLFYLTAPALGLLPVSAACVAKGEKGLLIFGPPNSGKTTSSYWARKLGLEFHADQASFLEIREGTIRAWGDFWPAAFRPETAQFLPELSTEARTLSYRDRTLLCLDKKPPIPGSAESVIPAACVFLERQASVPKLIPLSSLDLRDRFGLTTPFKDDAGSKEQREAVLNALSRVPSYRLLYGGDPSVAAVFCRSVLNTHRLIGERA